MEQHPDGRRRERGETGLAGQSGFVTEQLPLTIVKIITQGSYCHEKSWNLKMHFPGLEKSWILGKMVEVMEESWNFIF